MLIEVRADGRKELVALADGYRESAESWADLLRDCARRGMHAPVLAVADGALGFRGALREIFPETREQRCWVHKTADVLAALPKSAHPGERKALAEIWNAEDRRHALDALTAFEGAYGRSSPRPSRRSVATSTSCSPSTTSPPSTGSTCAPLSSSRAAARMCDGVTYCRSGLLTQSSSGKRAITWAARSCVRASMSATVHESFAQRPALSASPFR